MARRTAWKVSKRTKRRVSSDDSLTPLKEAAIRDLSAVIQAGGYTVRREKLKQGHSWKTVSGACRVCADKVVFVDRKIPLDEQLLFLISVASSIPVSFDEERFRAVLGAGPRAAANKAA